MMPPFVVFPTNRIAHFVEVSLYLFYLAQQVKLVIALYDVTANSVEGEDQVIAGKCLDVWDKMYEFNVGLARSLTEQMLCV